MSALAVPCRHLAGTVPRVMLAEIVNHDFVLTGPLRRRRRGGRRPPGRRRQDESAHRTAEGLVEGAKLDAEIRKNLSGLGYGG